MNLNRTAISLFFIVIITFFAGCNNDSNVNDSIKIESIENAINNADSARKISERLNGRSFKDNENKARLYMLNIISDFHTGKKADNDSLALILEEQYKNCSDHKIKAISKMCIGLVYSSIGENNKAIKSFTDVALLEKEACSDAVGYLTFTQWGWIIRSEYPYSEAIDKFNKAIYYAKRMKDKDKEVNGINLKGWEYMYARDFDKALATFNEALYIAKANKCPDTHTIIKSIASAYEMKGLHKRALSAINTAIDKCNGNDIIPLYAIKGVILKNLQQYDSARIYIDKGRQDKEYYQKASYLYDMSELEDAKGNYRNALRYLSQYATTLDSMYEEQHRQELIKVQKQYNFTLLNAERNKLELESQRKTNLIIMLIVISIFVILIISYFYNRRQKIIKHAMSTKERLLSKSISEIKDKNYQLMKAIQENNIKKIALMQEMDKKDIILNELRTQQTKLKEKIFLMNDTIKKIEKVKEMNEKTKISQATQITLSKDERANLLDSTNICYEYFIDRLKDKYQDLTEDDLCLCCMLKLQISTQDQCVLLGINDSTLRKRKYRLKNKKMMLPEAFDTLDNYICSF